MGAPKLAIQASLPVLAALDTVHPFNITATKEMRTHPVDGTVG
jgi:hypothetical protein